MFLVIYFWVPLCVFFSVFLLRRAEILNRNTYFYNNIIGVFYCFSVFFVLPYSDFFGNFLLDLVRSTSSAAQGLEIRLHEHAVPPERSRKVMVLYCFSIVWVFWSSAFMGGVAVGFCADDIANFKKNSVPDVNGKSVEMAWGTLIVLGGLSLLIVGGVVAHDLIYSPLEPVGYQCRKTCSSLRFWIYPYFAKLAVFIYGWHFFLVGTLKIAAWKMAKRSFLNGK